MLRVDLYSAAGAKLDVPPLAGADIIGCTYALKLNEIGTFQLVIAAGCRAAVNAVPGRQVWIYNEPTEGLVFKGIINDSDFTETVDGQATQTLTGLSLAAALNWKSTLIGRLYSAEPAADVVDDLLDGTVFTAGRVAAGKVTLSLDGISVWEALGRTAALFGAVLREDNINSEIDFVDVQSRVHQGILDTNNNSAEEDAGTVTLGGSGGSTFSSLDATTDWAGIRWPNVQIPQGATITSAILEVVPRAVSVDEPDVTIYGELVADSGVFVASANNISNRSRTSRSVSWSSTDLGANGTSYFDSPDLASLVQEIVDQPTWEPGNALSILIQGSSDSARDLDFYLSASSYQYAPRFTISYAVTAPEAGPTFAKFSSMPPTISQDLIPIASFKKKDAGLNIVNKILAIGEMQRTAGDARFLDLRNSTRTTPYAIQTDTGPDGFDYHYVEDTDSQAIYGVRERTIKFSGIVTPALADGASASDQLYEAAVSYLQQHSGLITYYDAEAVGLQHYVDGEATIEVGNLARVMYSASIEESDGVREYLSVDERLYVTEMQRTFDASSASTWDLQFASEPVPQQTMNSILSAITAHAMDGSTIPLPRTILGVGGDGARTNFRMMTDGQFSWLTDNAGSRITMIDIDKTVPAGLGSSVSDTFEGSPIHALFMVACYDTANGSIIGHIFGSVAVSGVLYAIATVTSASNGSATAPSISLNASGGFDYEAHATKATRFVGLAMVAYSD